VEGVHFVYTVKEKAVAEIVGEVIFANTVK
jgi:hypothetical protein